MQPPKKPDLLFKNREELDRAIRHVSRRNFIEGSLSAAILAAAAAFYPPDVAAQARYRLRRKPAPSVAGARHSLRRIFSSTASTASPMRALAMGR
jgi:hypothetical protein